jgi:diguanylate cyclase (GGDEF)-like protein/PAS domain S-box-containing protein
LRFKVSKKKPKVKCESLGKNNFIRYKDLLWNKEIIVYFFVLLISFYWLTNYFYQAKEAVRYIYLNEQQDRFKDVLNRVQDYISYAGNMIVMPSIFENKLLPIPKNNQFAFVGNQLVVKTAGTTYAAPVSAIFSDIFNSSLNFEWQISGHGVDIHSENFANNIEFDNESNNLKFTLFENRLFVEGSYPIDPQANSYILTLQASSHTAFESILMHQIEFYITLFVFLVLALSITILLLNKQAMHAHRHFLHTVSNTISEGQITINANGRIESANTAAQSQLGYIEQELKGMMFNELLGSSDFDIDRHDNVVTIETLIKKRGEVDFTAEITISPIYMRGDKVGSIAVLRDVTERIESEQSIKKLAFYDALTGLPNRRMLLKILQETMIEAERSGQWGALFFMDMDNFKILNDTKGHEAGDILLKEVARRLGMIARGNDVSARLGGDEFVILMREIGKTEEEAFMAASNLGNRLLAHLGKPYDINGASHNSTPSVGVTLFLGGAIEMEEIFRRSDMAMYEAKGAGRNNVKFFDNRLLDKIMRRNDIDTALKSSMKNNELFCMLQPQVRHSGELYGAELLMRWRNSELGLISPAEFIPVAEETGMIVEMGYWILNEACQIIQSWKNKRLPYDQWVLSINVSPLQLREPNFVDRVVDIISQYDIAGSNLKMEITETGTIKDINTVIAKVNKLKNYGISFSMDDFGTGYSSMTYLRQLPIDQLKIDQSFVKGMTDQYGNDDVVIVRTIIDMAKNLSLVVVAEGVETIEQLRILDGEGCDIYQGYLFGRPQRLEEFEEEWGNIWLAEHFCETDN